MPYKYNCSKVTVEEGSLFGFLSVANLTKTELGFYSTIYSSRFPSIKSNMRYRLQTLHLHVNSITVRNLFAYFMFFFLFCFFSFSRTILFWSCFPHFSLPGVLLLWFGLVIAFVSVKLIFFLLCALMKWFGSFADLLPSCDLEEWWVPIF